MLVGALLSTCLPLVIFLFCADIAESLLPTLHQTAVPYRRGGRPNKTPFVTTDRPMIGQIRPLLVLYQSESDPEILVSSGGELDSDRKKDLDREFLDIAAPALIQLTAEPLASLVDTAYLGRLGAAVLGGAGVAVSAQYAVSKLYNDPLLRTSISLVATAKSQQKENENAVAEAVSSALLLALVVGVVQMALYAAFARRIVYNMGVTPQSPMFQSAFEYLQVRAYGTPAATMWLVTNGIFRGLGDTRTPLFYSIFFTVLNAILDPLFIFVGGYGAAGAAAGTTIAQYCALIPLVRALHRRVPFLSSNSHHNIMASLRQYLQAGLQVFFRTVAKVWAYAICARHAAMLGPVAAAAYNLTFQLGFAVTQVCEAIAIAVQTMMAREITKNNSGVCRHLIRIAVRSGGVVACGLSALTWFRRDVLLRSLTTDIGIQAAAKSIFPMVLLTQVAKGLAYPVNGIIMGGRDWTFSMIVMWVANGVCLSMLRGGAMTLERLWWALAAFMTTQVVLGVLRYESRSGPWKVLVSMSSRESAAN